MKAAIFNGLPGDSGSVAAYDTLMATLQQVGWDLVELNLAHMKIAPCLGCFGCWVKTPGQCVIDDAGRETARAAVQSDLSVFVTPVTFGGYSSTLKSAVDRLIPNISPFFQRIKGEIHHRKRYHHPQRLVVLGIMPESDETSEGIFRELARRNAINLHSQFSSGIVSLSAGPAAVREKIRTILQEGGVTGV